MVILIDEIYEKVKSTLQIPENINLVSEWAEKTYNQFWDDKEYEILSCRLINDILIRIRDIVEEVMDLLEITEKEKKFIVEEMSDILEYLNGNKIYNEVMKINLSSRIIPEDRKILLKEIRKLLIEDIILGERVINSINDSINVLNPQTIEDSIFLEILISSLLINSSKFSFDKSVQIGTIGVNVKKQSALDEIQYLKELIEAYEGKKSFRFSVSLRKDQIVSMNIYVI